MVDLHRKRPSTILSITQKIIRFDSAPPDLRCWCLALATEFVVVGHRTTRFAFHATLAGSCSLQERQRSFTWRRRCRNLTRACRSCQEDQELTFFVQQPFCSSILKYWKADLSRWPSIFWGSCKNLRHLDTWTENIFSCRASASIDSDFQCRHPAASSRAPLKGVAGHFWFTNEMTFNKSSLFKFIHWGFVLFL